MNTKDGYAKKSLTSARLLTADGGDTDNYLPLTGGTMTGALVTTALSVAGAATFSQTINGSILGNAATASRLQNARTISLTGSVTGSVSFDGSGNVSLATTTNHTHLYAGSSSAGGAANRALYANKVYGIYTSNGGQQGPSYYGKNYAGFLMSNASVAGNSHYKNWLYMDCYHGNDAGGTTALGLDRTEPRAFIMQSTSARDTWSNFAEILTTYNFNQYIGGYSGYCGSHSNTFDMGIRNLNMYSWTINISDSSYPVIIYSDRIDCRCALLTFKLQRDASEISIDNIGFASYNYTNHTLSNQIMFIFDDGDNVSYKVGNTISLQTWPITGEEIFKIEIIDGVAYFYMGNSLLDKVVVNSSIARNIVGYFTTAGNLDVDEINYARSTINQYTSLPGGVNISNPTNGQVLKFNGTNWVNGTDNTSSGSGGSTVSLPSGDITLSTTAQTYITADSVTRKIKLPATCPWTVGSTTLSGLTDTTISSPSNGQYLKYNGSKWINSAGPSIATSWCDSSSIKGLVSPTLTDSKPTIYIPKTEYVAFPVMQDSDGNLWVALPADITGVCDISNWDEA